jgi:8-oxo-dGDP phosphatase
VTAWFETIASTVTHEGVLSRVRVDTLRTPQGDEVEREVVEHDDAVAVVPLLDGGDVVLLRQYRHPFRSYLIEIPAGKLDVDGEGPEEAARRELIEETGLEPSAIELLTVFRNSAGWTDETTHVFLGRGLVEVGRPDGFSPKGEEADMEIVRLPLRDAVAAVEAGTISDAKTVIGLLLAERHGD